MERGKYKVEKIVDLGEAKHNGRTYRVTREKIVDTGDEYISIILYNSQGKFIKRMMLDDEVCFDIGVILAELNPENLWRRYPHLFSDETPKPAYPESATVLKRD